jgi:aminoglycoside phosphotransferase (APT) family kinase protein
MVLADGQPMAGGNSGVVVRQGDTVRRPSGPWTPLVQRLMRELRSAAVDGVPEPLGLDDAGREVVEFVAGEVGIYPMPAWVWTDRLLVDVARRIRQIHDTTGTLDLPTTGWRRAAVAPAEVICHGDLAPYNTVCRAGRLVALIDWDYAMPAPRLWDLGYAAYRWVSLTPLGHPDGSTASVDDKWRRLDVFCQAYGDVEPLDVVRWAVVRLDDEVQHASDEAAAGNQFFQAAIDAGHSALYRADAAWLRSTYLDEG